MALRIWPKDFERKEHITKEEKALLRNATQNLSDGHFVVGIDPVGMLDKYLPSCIRTGERSGVYL